MAILRGQNDDIELQYPGFEQPHVLGGATSFFFLKGRDPCTD